MSPTRGTLLWIEVPGLGARVATQTYADGARIMRMCRAVILPACEVFGGRVASVVGDSFHVVFRRPMDALLAAAAAQDRAVQHSRESGEKLDLRACAVSGEMRVDRNGVFGDLVDLAARVRGAAARGDVVLTGDVFAAMDLAQCSAEELGDSEGVPADVRLYRLGRAPRGSDLPYGGLGLAKAGRLPQIGPDGMLELGESAISRAMAKARALLRRTVPLLGSVASWARSSLQSVASRAHRSFPGIGLQIRRAWAGVRAITAAATAGVRRMPRRLQIAVGAGLAIAVVGPVILATRGDGVDRALSRRDFRTARRELKHLKDTPDRAYAEARIQEARGSFAPAAAEYAKAARGGEQRGLKQLVRMTESKSCEARTSAARALGELGDPRAVPALQKLEKARFSDERADAGVFRCSSKRAAREALEQLQRRPG